jgi:hypothetical protein
MKACATVGAVLLATWVATGCGGGEPPPEAPVREEDPADAVLRIGTTWESRGQDKGFRSQPSPVAMFESVISDRLRFAEGGRSAREALKVEESFRMQDGATFHCGYQIEIAVQVQFGRRNGDPAVQIDRPETSVPRQCDAPGFPEQTLTMPPSSARFVLKGDQLVAFEPVTERRTFIPAQ